MLFLRVAVGNVCMRGDTSMTADESNVGVLVYTVLFARELRVSIIMSSCTHIIVQCQEY